MTADHVPPAAPDPRTAVPPGPGRRVPADTGLLGPLGRRLLAAFILVTLLAVAALTLASLVGTGAGLDLARQEDRAQAAARVAASAAAAYARAGGWSGADLAAARSLAAGAGARLAVLDATGRTVQSPSGTSAPPDSVPSTSVPSTSVPSTSVPSTSVPSTSVSPTSVSPASVPPHGPGQGMGSGQGITTAPVLVGGAAAGSVQLRFGAPAGSAARDVAWGWIIAAALVALLLALAAGLLVTRRLTGPIGSVTRAARSFAAGDRAARARVRAPGELGELAHAFDELADQVTRAEQARRRLAADVAHELRTPLTALQAGLEELRDGLAEPEPARLGVLHDQALRLGRIVGDLAELSAAESAALSLRPREVDLARLARQVLAAAEPRLRAADLDVHADLAEGVTVRADPDRLHQAIGNLLDNAARYCAPHDTVTVTVRASGGAAIVEVADTGPGIPADDLPHVFDRLWRGRSGAGVSGSGIGLAVVRELVTAHHGTVTARSRPGGGATFTIRLPKEGDHRERP